MGPRADLRRSLHHLDLTRALHAPQLPNERCERPPLVRRYDVQIRRRLWPCPQIVIVFGYAVPAREVILQEPRSRGRGSSAPMMLPVKTVEEVSGGGGHIDVHVFGAGGEGAQVIGEVLEGARVVGAEERDDVFEARRCAVPFFFGRVFARAIEEHAEAAR